MTFASIIIDAAPLMTASFGALISDCASRLAIFMEGIINLASFLCFAFSLKLGAGWGSALAIISCVLFSSVFLFAAEATGADPFLIALSLNITSNAAVSLFSSRMFGTRGVLTSSAFVFDAAKTDSVTAVIAIILLSFGTCFLLFTRWGLYIRLCGKDSAVLEDSGIRAKTYVRAAWIIAAAFGAVSGLITAFRFSSFVPGGAGGRGWLSCAVVYMARSVPVTSIFNLRQLHRKVSMLQAALQRKHNGTGIAAGQRNGAVKADRRCNGKVEAKRLCISLRQLHGKGGTASQYNYTKKALWHNNGTGKAFGGNNGTGGGGVAAVFFSSIAICAASSFALRLENLWPSFMPSLTISSPYIACLLLLAVIGKKV